MKLTYAPDDFVAKVSCDLAEPSRSPETGDGETYCFVELSFHVARVEVKCCEYFQGPKYFVSSGLITFGIIGSANSQLIGQYVGDWEARQG